MAPKTETRSGPYSRKNSVASESRCARIRWVLVLRNPIRNAILSAAQESSRTSSRGKFVDVDDEVQRALDQAGLKGKHASCPVQLRILSIM